MDDFGLYALSDEHKAVREAVAQESAQARVRIDIADDFSVSAYRALLTRDPAQPEPLLEDTLIRPLLQARRGPIRAHTGLSLAPFRRLGPLFGDAISDDGANQIQRQGPIEGELNRALGGFVSLQLRGKGRHAARRGIQTDMLGKSRKMNQIAVELEGRHAVGNFFAGFGSFGANQRAQRLQTLLDLGGKAGDIGGDRVGVGAHCGIAASSAGM